MKPAAHIMEHDAASAPVSGEGATAKGSRPGKGAACPECSHAFLPVRARQVFCTPACQATFQNRNGGRGRTSVIQLAIAWRAGRNQRGKSPAAVEARAISARAFQELCALIDDFARQDRAAGRDAIAYLRATWRKEGTL